MKRTILTTIFALSIVLGTGRANATTSADRAKEHYRLEKPVPVNATRELAEQKEPVGLNSQGHTDREEPRLLIAPCPGCGGKSSPSLLEQIQQILAALFFV